MSDFESKDRWFSKMMLACPVCEEDIDAPEIDGETFKCPYCKAKLQSFCIGGFWEVHRAMKIKRDDDDE
ncbi:MAG TPA: hypothetical protein PK718_00645 [Candidatus Methanofastidiosa archaeon]|nr:hypothetical protein [Candidatus Methanofastidiosa archaeon]